MNNVDNLQFLKFLKHQGLLNENARIFHYRAAYHFRDICSNYSTL